MQSSSSDNGFTALLDALNNRNEEYLKSNESHEDIKTLTKELKRYANKRKQAEWYESDIDQIVSEGICTTLEKVKDGNVENLIVTAKNEVRRAIGKYSTAFQERTRKRKGNEPNRPRECKTHVQINDEDKEAINDDLQETYARIVYMQPEAELLKKEKMFEMMSLVEELKPKEKMVIIQNLIHGYTINEYAQRNNIKPNTATKQRRKGLEKLELRMKQLPTD